MRAKKKLLLIFCLLCIASQLPAEEAVKIYAEKKKGGGYYFYGDNLSLIPYHVVLEFPKLQNLEASQTLPYAFVLQPDSKKNYILSLDPPAKGRYSYKYYYQYFRGDPWSVSHDDDYLYLFPYAHGEKYRVNQGYNGSSTHTGSGRFALDFSMDTGSPIYAAREGLVIGVREDSNKGGPGEEYADYGNYVDIYHADGSFAVYVHLEQNGAIVKPGDRVRAGQVIGYSGNTGRSSGPHLHFAVSIPVFKGSTTIPTHFLDYDYQPVEPGQGNYYYATHPGQPAFDVQLGREISNAAYADYSRDTAATGRFEIRTERIDDNILFFVKNGLEIPKNLNLDFTLVNMQPSRELPYGMYVPPLKEVFVLYLEIIDFSEGWQYKYSYRYKNVN